MKPVSVRFKCFGPYMAEQFVDFEELEKNGLFLISGETGAGKTTILDAMCYALYGRSSGGLRGDLSVMRCSLAAKEDESLTEFIFDCNGRRYKFIRTLKYGRKHLNDSHNCLVLEGDVWVPIFENPKATVVNQKAQELIGLTYDQFRQVIILPQGQFEKLLVSDSVEKEKILVSLFHADRWQRIAEEVHHRVSEQDNLLKQEKQQIALKLREFGCEDLPGLEEKTADQRSILEQLQREVKAAEEQIGTLRERSQQALLENKEFEELARVQRQFHALDKRKEEFDAEEQLLKVSDVAETLRPAFLQYQECGNQLFRNRQLEKDARLVLEEAARQLAAAEKSRQTHEASREAYEENTRQVLVLKNARELYGTLEEKERTARAAKKEFDGAKLALDQAEQVFSRLDGDWKKAVLTQNKAISDFQTIQAAYLRGIGSTLAQSLVPGQPCPVCGSTQHPCPAEAGEGHVSEAQLQKADRAMKAANEAASLAMEQRNAAEKDRALALDAAHQAQQAYVQAKADYEAALAGQIPGIGSTNQLEKQIRYLEAEVASFQQAETDILGILTDARGKDAAARERLTAAAQELSAAQIRYTAETALWQQALADSGLETQARFLAADMKPEEKQRRRMALLQFRTDLGQAEQQLKEKEAALAGSSQPDMAAIQKELAAAEKAYRDISGQQLLASENLKAMEQTVKNLTKRLQTYDTRRQAVDADLDFANRLRGRSGVSLQRYVLGVMLTSITVEANRLLANVYGGRYRLYRTDLIAGSGQKSGLELEVYDAQNNQRRSVTTLSGGEKFLVALSLAIGLSTVVQAQGSGIRLEAMFIDEGFGSLDREAVQDALEILQGIQRSSGIVGIISHVEQLAEIIPTRLEITKGKNGSICHIRT